MSTPTSNKPTFWQSIASGVEKYGAAHWTYIVAVGAGFVAGIIVRGWFG